MRSTVGEGSDTLCKTTLRAVKRIDRFSSLEAARGRAMESQRVLPDPESRRSTAAVAALRLLVPGSRARAADVHPPVHDMVRQMLRRDRQSRRELRELADVVGLG